MKKRIVVAGAGLAGLSAAWHLQKKGIECLVFEKEAEPGGLCRSKKIGGFTFDYDGHLLHFKHRYVFDLVRGLFGDDLVKHERSSWIFSCGRYTRYPFQANLYGLPPRILEECLSGFIRAQAQTRCGRSSDFLDWIENVFGKGIARHFMIPYNTKFWTVPPQKLTCEWLEGIVPVPSRSQIIEGAAEESCEQLGYNVHFWYPRKGGIQQLPAALARQVKNIRMKSQISEIDLIKKEVVTSSGYREKFDHLISTFPLPEMALKIKGLPALIKAAFDKLRWNSVFNLNLGIEGKDTHQRHWVYFPQKDVSFFRVGFPHNFSSDVTPANGRSLYTEVAYSPSRPIRKQGIAARIIHDLKKTGILSGRDKIRVRDINDIEYGYPIYDRNYKKSRERIVKFLTERGVVPCGRYGSWRYMSMEDAILDGRRVAEALTR